MTKEHKPDEKYLHDWEFVRRNTLRDVNPHAEKVIIYTFDTVISLKYPPITASRQNVISFSQLACQHMMRCIAENALHSTCRWEKIF
jgi:hypothetical protein